jgi:predicted ATPase/class 3 adenylate cyclase
MPELPMGTVTFLFTDVEGSTRLWEEQPMRMPAALARHDALIEDEVERHGGVVVRPRGEGDSRFAVFARATEAVAAAVAIQQALHVEMWPLPTPLRVRMALHTGEADLRGGDYYGSAVNRCARLRAIAHGGQTLLSQATYDLVRDALPSGLRVRDLGEHRLADLHRPEQVYQLLADGVPTDFPPLRSLETIPNNLPLQLTSFVGREREMAEVTRLLEGARLLTLTGPGGTGKTRLALQVAADVLGRYPQGVWLVELAPLADPALVPQALATVLGVRDDATRPLLTVLAEVVRPKRLLMLFDNCEHVIAACAQAAEALVRACPHVQVLATSREALGITGETAYRVPSLSLPAAQSVALDTLRQSEAVRLFDERARAAQPHFALTPANVAAVVQVCRRLDGIPLALEMAAARVRGLAVEQVASRLDQRFRLLTGGSRTALPRQQTLQATVEWSYALLDRAEQTLFNRLSVFAGGWMLEAAEAVCAGGESTPEDVLDLLLRLVDKSLVVADSGAESGIRYRLLETLRHYGRERLVTTEEAALVQGHHAAYFLALAEEAERRFQGGGQRSWLTRLDPEYDNLLAAAQWWIEQGETERSQRLAAALFGFWEIRGHRSQGRAVLKAALATPEATPTPTRVKALAVAGWMAISDEDLAQARALLTESLTLARQLADQHGVGFACLALAHWAGHAGDPAAQCRSARRAVRVLQASGDRWATGWALTELAQAYLGLGDTRTARTVCTESVALRQELGDRLGEAAALWHLAEICAAEGESVAAQRLLEKAITLGRAEGDLSTLIWSLYARGHLALEQGDLAAAHALYTEGLICARDGGYRPLQRRLVEACAALAAARGQPERALRLAGAVAALYDPLSTGGGSTRPLESRDAGTHRVRWRERAQQALGRAAAEAAWGEGQAMTLEEAVAYALEDLGDG